MSELYRLDRETIVIPGLKHTYRVLQLADSHMSPDSPLDTDEMRAKAAKHREVWMAHGNGVPQEDNFAHFAAMIADENIDLAVLCGDMTDFPSPGTAAEGHRLYETLGNYLYVPGNHEQGVHYPDWFAAATRSDPALQIVELEELVFVGVDNGCEPVSHETMDRIEAVLHGDKPVILVHHIPVDCETLHPAAVDYWEDVKYFLFGLAHEDADDEIDRYNRLLSEEHSQLRAVLAGHLHFDHIDTFPNGVTQYVAAPCLAGYGRILTITG